MAKKGDAWAHRQTPSMMTLEYEPLWGWIDPDNYIGSAFWGTKGPKLVIVLQTKLPFGN